jgi:hypothetical protein
MTNNSASFLKDPNEVLDFQISWLSWLGASETISTSTWVVPAGITKDSDTSNTTSATIWLSSGTSGAQYTVTNRIVTNQGRTRDQSLLIQVVDR